MSSSDLLDQARLDVVEAARKCIPGSGRIHSEGAIAAFGRTFENGFAMVPLDPWIELLGALFEERRATATYLHDAHAPHDSDQCARCGTEKKETVE